MFRSIAIVVALCFATVTAQAALLSRAGGQAYYDDVLNITWLADVKYAVTNGFGVPASRNVAYRDEIGTRGSMDWSTANLWIDGMNAANHLGASNWRLPFVVDTGSPDCDWSFVGGTDCGYNVQTMTGTTVYSEMAHLYYVTLGNSSSGCPGSPLFCLTNTGPFANVQGEHYWSGSSDSVRPWAVWDFHFAFGYQAPNDSGNYNHAWAVHDGDPFSVVPVPPAVFLFGSALGVMGWMRRKAVA